MKESKIIVECKKVKFYASYDEDAFFEWLAKIESVTNVQGRLDSIFLTINKLSDDDLYNLVGLFRRYKIKLENLKHLLNESQKDIFYELQKGHHINVYPASNDIPK